MRVRVGARQLQVLRLLYTHRLLTAAQVQALAFETATRRTCEICLQRLHRKGWVVRAEPLLHGGAGGGRSGYVYGLSAQGAEVLATMAGIPLADIPTVAGPEVLEARYVNPQRAVNRCLPAVREACRAHPRAALRAWTADPHARARYQVGRSWRTVQPDTAKGWARARGPSRSTRCSRTSPSRRLPRPGLQDRQGHQDHVPHRYQQAQPPRRASSAPPRPPRPRSCPATAS